MKKSKTDTAVVGGVLGENDKKISDIEKSIKAALDRKRKIIMESKLYIYGQLAELYGKEGQELLDAVIVEHTLIGKLTASGMTYDQIAELADAIALPMLIVMRTMMPTTAQMITMLTGMASR